MGYHLLLCVLLCYWSIQGTFAKPRPFESDEESTEGEFRVKRPSAAFPMLSEILLVLADDSYTCTKECATPALVAIMKKVYAERTPLIFVPALHLVEDDCGSFNFQPAAECLKQCPYGQSSRLASIVLDIIMSACTDEYKAVIAEQDCVLGTETSGSLLKCSQEAVEYQRDMGLTPDFQSAGITFDSIMEAFGFGCGAAERALTCYVKDLVAANCNPQAIEVFYETARKGWESLQDYAEEIGAPEETLATCDWARDQTDTDTEVIED